MFIFGFLPLFVWSALGQDVFPPSIDIPAFPGPKFHLASFVNLQERVKSSRKGGLKDARPRDKRQNDDERNNDPPPSTDAPDQCPIKSKPKDEPELPFRRDTTHTTHKHDFTYNDVSTKSTRSPTRFSDMGYLLFGYDIYKGNPLTFGFDPGFRHPLFDHGDIEDYLTTVDGRHTQPPGTAALPSQACSATFRQTVIQTVEDLQERQGSVSEESFGIEDRRGEVLADAIPDAAKTNPKVAGLVAVAKSIQASHSSMNNKEYKGEMASANRADSRTIIAEATCNVYQAKLNQAAPPPLLPEVKAWILKMIDIQKGGETSLLRTEIINFLEYYGTHIVTGINFGARYMYNFTLTANSEAELTDTFDSFKSAVNTELRYLGLGATSSKRNAREEGETAKRNMFEEIVEISLKSVGAPLPEIKDDGAPDSKEWAKDAFENPVPIKISHVGIENILEKQILGEDFIEENACKGIGEKDLMDLKKEFVRSLPRKAVGACKRTIRQCDKVFLKGKDLDDMKKLIACAEIVVKFESIVDSEDKGKLKFSGLDEILTSNATEAQRQCLKKTEVIKKMYTAYDAIKQTLDVDLYDLNLDIPGGLLGLLEKGFEEGWGAVADLLGLNKADKKKEKLWERYGKKIVEALMPENLAKECFQKTKCYKVTRWMACTKIAGYKNESYTESLNKRGGIPAEELLLVDAKTASIEEEIKKEIKKGIQKLDEQDEVACRISEDGEKDDEPKECEADQVDGSEKNEEGEASEDSAEVDRIVASLLGIFGASSEKNEEGEASEDSAPDVFDDPPNCAEPGSKGKDHIVDCCKVFAEYTDPRYISKIDPEAKIKCDPNDCEGCNKEMAKKRKNRKPGCSVYCFGWSEEDKRRIAKLCKGKKDGTEVEVEVDTTKEKRFVKCGSPWLALKDEPSM